MILTERQTICGRLIDIIKFFLPLFVSPVGEISRGRRGI